MVMDHWSTDAMVSMYRSPLMATFALAERLPTCANLDPNQGIHKPLLSNNFLDTFGNANFLDKPLN